MPIQVASRKNREAAATTDARGRRNRIQGEFDTTGMIRGDYANKSAMRDRNKHLTGQVFGNRAQKAYDIKRAFGIAVG